MDVTPSLFFLNVYFYSDTCGVCKKLKGTTLKDVKVRKILPEHFVVVRVYITDHSNKASIEIKKKFNVLGTPSFVFFDQSGKEIG
ncbi:thioredoxin fold domain-containing protein [Sulfurovum sp.]|uniref:thioredoxin fold domain-containing protein n=1 Tax=Sulfurovum sp. TaxID=1969726 RepID=UPI0025FD8EDB|nr:thioredoxin fold domain-containing protein [Sulfurovum sp.]